MLEKMEMGKNPKECFAEMSKNGKMQDGLGSEMMQLDSPKLQKSMEEFINRNGKATFHEITEYNVSWLWKEGHSRVVECTRLTPEGGYPGKCELFFRSTHGARAQEHSGI